jgi:hypothetical protein
LNTIAKAHARGYVAEPRAKSFTLPYIIHWRLHNKVDVVSKPPLDAARPESLMFFYPKAGPPVLLGYMYRAFMTNFPSFGGEILMWHHHDVGHGPGKTMMTHVWLTRGLKSAYARCLPRIPLEHAIKGFHYEPVTMASGAETLPCPADGMMPAMHM